MSRRNRMRRPVAPSEVRRSILARAIDGVFEQFAPRLSVHREAARFKLHLMRTYEGASVGSRTEGWITPGSSSNAEIGSSLSWLRNRSRQLVRDNEWAKQAVRRIVSNSVGSGIVARPMSDSARSKKRAAELWKAWAVDSTDCDPEGRRNFAGLQKQVQRCVVESGEALIRLRRRRLSDGLAVPIQLQLLEPDFLDTSKDGNTKSGGAIIQGVEYGPRGNRIAYHLFPEHPGDSHSLSMQSRRVSAASVLHIFEGERIGQVRGVPWGASCLIRLRDLDEFEDAHLVREKIAAMFVAFVHDITDGTDEASKPDQDEEELMPGTMRHLPLGKTVTFGRPPSTQGFDSYVAQGLRAIAAGYGLTYEALTGDYSKTNYSSARAGWLEWERDLTQWVQLELIPQLCTPVWRWFVDAASLAGLMPQGVGVSWTPPRRAMLDPEKEVKGIVAKVRAGLCSLADAIRASGLDPDEVLQELSKDMALARELGLVLDTDGATDQGQRVPGEKDEPEDPPVEPPTENPPAGTEDGDSDDENAGEDEGDQAA